MHVNHVHPVISTMGVYGQWGNIDVGPARGPSPETETRDRKKSLKKKLKMGHHRNKVPRNPLIFFNFGYR